jgi:2-amino-4-hydroxy-6-hydroxymethyldihydropteridine diphosphokinase
MARAYVSIGSNIEPEAHVREAVRDLRNCFGDVTLSRVYRTRAVGFEGPDFYNLVAGFNTDMAVRTLRSVLRDIEMAHGRRRDLPRFSPRTLDLDLLLYGDLILQQGDVELPRDEITRHAFVLGPLAEIAGSRKHPVLGVTIGELWARFPDGESELRAVPLPLG